MTGGESPPARLAILTGEIGAGKTTAALAVTRLASERGLSVGGILSPARIDASGTKVGIDALDVATGERRVLATVGGDLVGPRVGAYAFDAASIAWGIERVQEAIAAGRELVCVDELGRMEFERGEAFAPLIAVATSGAARRMLAVVRLAHAEGLAARVGAVSARVFRVAATPASRERVPADLLDWML